MSYPQAHSMPLAATPHAVARRALVDEQICMRHYRKALACTEDAKLLREWRLQLEASRGRAARLAIVLLDAGEPMPVAEQRDDAARCLLDAMDMALCNGDMMAAELVARECVSLIGMRRAPTCDALQ